MGFKVKKKVGKTKEVLDSTHSSMSKANERRDTLRKSYRGQKAEVWVEATTEDDPKNYKRPIKHKWVNYNN